ncbi:cytochrome c oxidase subunit 3 [Paraburkholderia fungorum]|uniref:cytochrome c oxidase subunit 3 n=1 Tax=Paraburkholderia fungorum TaxID=134537 RepID=UPI0038BD2856
MADRLDAAAMNEGLPVGSVGRRAGGWWGMLTLIATEGTLFGYLIFSYLYLYSQGTQHWPPDGPPKLGAPGFNTVVLLTSSVFVWLGERFVKRDRRGFAVASLGIAIVLGIVFVGVQMKEYRDRPYGPATHLYGSLYFFITGLHMLHVIIGLAVLILLLGWTASGYFDRDRHEALTIGGLYWHFVDAVWLFIFATLFISPYVL